MCHKCLIKLPVFNSLKTSGTLGDQCSVTTCLSLRCLSQSHLTFCPCAVMIPGRQNRT
ncbi:hypothetical protein AB205_0130950 [Aquarana catesbeiana]|uniref:Uncharacterized protein n=1 Tax=Aquarana catesbeiana TaxID=8400 RepID=A0A2G9RGJ4_AQUCT|nr:hypothetical protein AB205_0130950 [Aquarana catesbeiana]